MKNPLPPSAALAAGSANPVDLSIVIPAWNEAEFLVVTIDRISDALRYPPRR